LDDHCCDSFSLVDDWLEAAGLQRRGWIGHAEARRIRSRELVEIVVSRLRRNETVFLHPEGFDK